MMSEEIFSQLKNSIANLDQDEAERLTNLAITEEIPAQEIISKGLVEGIKIIGDGFEKHEFFLPELMLSGEIMKSAFCILEPHMKASGIKSAGKVVLGTVQGDIHDIGKNIVGALLEGNGFEVYDLGVDVSTETFLEKISEVDPDIVALSALLSSTVSIMFDTVTTLREQGVKAKIIVGGAAVSKEAADDMKADAYGKDAWAGVKIVKQFNK